MIINSGWGQEMRNLSIFVYLGMYLNEIVLEFQEIFFEAFVGTDPWPFFLD